MQDRFYRAAGSLSFDLLTLGDFCFRHRATILPSDGLHHEFRVGSTQIPRIALEQLPHANHRA